MLELQGTEKETAYASCIREYVLYQLENLNVPELEGKKQKFISAITRQKKAKVIIKSFVSSFRLENVKVIALDFLTYENKFTQKEILSFSERAVTIDETLKDDKCEIKKYEIEESKQKNNEEVKNEFISASEKQIKYLKDLMENTDNMKLEFNGVNLEYYKELIKSCKENKLSRRDASKMIDTLLECQKFKCKNGDVKFFECRYDTRDCETGEHIEAGELVWKDSEGIHRADNY
ncbi:MULTISPECIES: hypothetical protein [Clostridium]|uniref:Uncharacterized protein n=1 Tax=Clostridium sporogenes TaxID=1509 RepID=A0A1J1CS67_CLOSG|nr:MULTISPECIES: hypothetical protein [Clostridium]APF25097.1 hypothetical protein NPD7_4091 [Clostridium sporogenes]APH14096.1 hypothetical protein NPD5_3879 [Clostridium sporogenes]MBD5639574.1 hypothetical protein [Clostridium botulinum]MDI6918939.1 hypothetical protein [Clostridium botulinum]WMU99539.1 hypothetical protein QA656_19610 [Clostridium botulinum]